MAALEAMACGLPWIAPPVGALADCAQALPGEPPSGILVRGWSAGAFADAMLTMMGVADGDRMVMGLAARRRIERDYELRTQARRLAGLVAELTLQGTIVTISETDRNLPAYFSEWSESRARQERV
jgi:glycosyltransferase involved in cell wall biosynthesis